MLNKSQTKTMTTDAESNAREQTPDPRRNYVWLLIGIVVAIGAVLGAGMVRNDFRIQEIRAEFKDRIDIQAEQLNRLDSILKQSNEELAVIGARVESLDVSIDDRIDAHAEDAEKAFDDRIEAQQAEIADLRATRGAQIQGLVRELAEFRLKTGTRVEALGQSVNGIKEQITTTNMGFENATGELAAVKTGLVEQRELITTNGEELSALMRFHEQKRHEFSLVKSEMPQPAGPFSVRLRGTSPKRNRYSISLLTNGKEIVRRRQTLFEPVQFHLGGTGIPSEFVVNKIGKDVIEGYLSIP